MLFSSRSETHAVTLLKKDHRLVEKLFSECEQAEDNATKVELVTQICQALTVHAEIEETIFYPRAMRALGAEDDELVREAAVEHGTLKGLIAQLNGATPRNAMFDAYVKVLKEYVQHHVKEEENELFPKVEATDLDLEALGQELFELKQKLESRVADQAKPSKSTVVVVDFTDQRSTRDSQSRSSRGGSARAA